jgi:glycosyltransferase involved in cell wall biosynthesis
MNAAPPRRMLFELRPALDGHAGIPQETRLLFRGLSTLAAVRVDGFLQSGSRWLAPGLRPAEAAVAGGLPADERVQRMGRIVITLDEPRTRRGYLKTALRTIGMAVRARAGGTLPLSRFDSRHFQDYLWQRLFAKTLPAEDFDLVTGGGFRVVEIPWGAMQICARVTSKIGPPIYAQLDTSEYDLMITETPYPATVSPNTQMLVRYHDAFPLLMPHTIADPDFQHAIHYLTLRQNVRGGAWFVCISEATRQDLLAVFPQAEARSMTIHNIVPDHYFDEDSHPDRVREIVRAHRDAQDAPEPDRAKPLQYLLMVSSIEPRKNHLALLAAWERLRVQFHVGLKLILVGSAGWHNEPIMRKFAPWIQQGEVLLLRNVAAQDLRRLYKHARATVCPSLGEGFDFSGVEAMKSGGAVVASDIPVHREVCADAAEYFNPYSDSDLVRAVRGVIDSESSARREALVRAGAVLARRYSSEAIMPQWDAFLRERARSP